MNIETRKQIAIGKYRDAIEQLSAIKNSWEKMKTLQDNFTDPESGNFVCFDFETYEKIVESISGLVDTLNQFENKIRDEKISAEIDLEICGINPREIDEIIFSQKEKQEC